jgi:hypothetical protein
MALNSARYNEIIEMTNCLTSQRSPRAAHTHVSRQAGCAISYDRHIFVIGRGIAAPMYRNGVHRARRARAVLVASAADVIGRAL